MMDTKVIITTFKESGKFYDSWTYYSKIAVYDYNMLKLEAMEKYPECANMDFTMKIVQSSDPEEGKNRQWNMYLIKKQ